jgi:hypothetical protein
MVKRWFGLLREKQIKHDSKCSAIELEQTIRKYLVIHNEKPQPFVWAKTTNEILSSLATFCKRISDPGQ